MRNSAEYPGGAFKTFGFGKWESRLILFKDAVYRFSQSIQFPFFIWMVILAHMLEGFTSYTVSMKLTKYLNQRLLLTDIQSSNVYVARVFIVLMLAVMGGWVIDKLQVKICVVLGFTINGLAKLALSQVDNTALAEFIVIVCLPIGSGLLVTPIHMVVDSLSYSRPVEIAMKNLAFSMLYTSNNFGDELVGLLDPYISGTGGAHQYDLLFVVTGVVSLMSALLMLTCFNPPKNSRVEEIDLTIDYPRQLKKCLWFAITMCPVRTLFQYLDVLMSKYIERVHGSYWMATYGTQVDSTRIISANPLIVLFLTPTMGILLQNVKTMHVLLIGTLLSALSPLVMILWRGVDTVWPEQLFMIIFSVSESIYSSRSIQLLMDMTPPGKKGLYSTISVLPALVASGLSGEQAGYLLYYFCPAAVRPEYDVWQTWSCQWLWSPIVAQALMSFVMLLIFNKMFSEPISKLKSRVEEGLVLEVIAPVEELLEAEDDGSDATVENK